MVPRGRNARGMLGPGWQKSADWIWRGRVIMAVDQMRVARIRGGQAGYVLGLGGMEEGMKRGGGLEERGKRRGEEEEWRKKSGGGNEEEEEEEGERSGGGGQGGGRVRKSCVR